MIAIQAVYWRVGQIYRNIASSIDEYWAVFTELFHGNALIKSITIFLEYREIRAVSFIKFAD
jgi:hypothetical protein